MSDHLIVDNTLHDAGFEDRIRGTFLGQAHFAGSGPAGTSCRQFAHWGVKFYPRDQDPYVGSPGYYSRSHEKPCALKRGGCHYPINNKSTRRFPHSAPACRFFTAADAPPPTVKPDDTMKNAEAA